MGFAQREIGQANWCGGGGWSGRAGRRINQRQCLDK
jgi:hypothetical protein